MSVAWKKCFKRGSSPAPLSTNCWLTVIQIKMACASEFKNQDGKNFNNLKKLYEGRRSIQQALNTLLLQNSKHFNRKGLILTGHKCQDFASMLVIL